MSDKHLTVAVIIPTYNRGSLISEAIDSLLVQTRLPDEIIVVDDGSTDNTSEVLERYKSPIKVIVQANSGRSAARNAGIRASNSDLLMFLDSDDTLLPSSIECHAAILEEYPMYDVVYSDAYLVNLDGSVFSKFSDFKLGKRHSGNVFAQFAYTNFCLIHAAMCKRTCFRDRLVFDETLNTSEDYDLWMRLSTNHLFFYLDKALANYRQHGDILTINLPDGLRRTNLIVQHRAIEMPTFQELAAAQKSRIYTSHGSQYAVLGQIAEARKWLIKSILTDPLYIKAYNVLAFTLLGKHGTRYAASLRRQILARIKL